MASLMHQRLHIYAGFVYLQVISNNGDIHTSTRGKVPAKLDFKQGWALKGREMRQGWKYARRLPYFGTMADKKDKNITLHLLPDSSRCRVVFLSFFSAIVLKYGSLLAWFHP